MDGQTRVWLCISSLAFPVFRMHLDLPLTFIAFGAAARVRLAPTGGRGQSGCCPSARGNQHPVLSCVDQFRRQRPAEPCGFLRAAVPVWQALPCCVQEIASAISGVQSASEDANQTMPHAFGRANTRPPLPYGHAQQPRAKKHDKDDSEPKQGILKEYESKVMHYRPGAPRPGTIRPRGPDLCPPAAKRSQRR